MWFRTYEPIFTILVSFYGFQMMASPSTGNQQITQVEGGGLDRMYSDADMWSTCAEARGMQEEAWRLHRLLNKWE